MAKERRLSKQDYGVAKNMKYGEHEVWNRSDGNLEVLSNAGLFIVPAEIYSYYHNSDLVGGVFSSGDEGRREMTYLEHDVIGSSTNTFFRHPFMGDYKLDKEWQEEIRKKREKRLEDSTKGRIGFYLYINPEKVSNFLPSGVVSDDVRDWGNTTSDERLNPYIEGLKSVFSGLGGTDFNSIDYIRLSTIPTNYDENMVAIPVPVSIDFVRNGKVVRRFDLNDKIRDNLREDIQRSVLNREIGRFTVPDIRKFGPVVRDNMPTRQKKKNEEISIHMRHSKNGIHVISCSPTYYYFLGKTDWFSQFLWDNNFRRLISKY